MLMAVRKEVPTIVFCDHDRHIPSRDQSCSNHCRVWAQVQRIPGYEVVLTGLCRFCVSCLNVRDELCAHEC